MLKQALLGRGSYCKVRKQWLQLVQTVTTVSSPNADITVPVGNQSVTSPTPEPTTQYGLKATVKDHTTTVARIFRTNETDPRKHDYQHIGLFYTVPNKVFHTALSSALNSVFKREMKAFGESCLMVRQPAVELFEIIQNLDLSHPSVRVILHGARGNGKSTTVAHLLHYCHLDNWFVVHVPWGVLWSLPFLEVSQNPLNQEMFDIASEGVKWLQHFKEQNSHLLEQFTLTKDYKWSIRESSKAGESFLQLVTFGISRSIFACSCIEALMEQLRIQASDKKFKLLVCIDGVNAFWRKTGLKFENEKIPPEKLTLVDSFKTMLQSSWSNGLSVCTVDSAVKAMADRKSDSPLHLLTRVGFEYLDPFIPIQVEEYSNKEIYNCLEYYKDRLWLQNPEARTEEGFKQLIHISGRNPYLLSRACAPM